MHLKQELEQRGFVNQFSNEKLFEIYDQGGQSFYCGFDPTADSLHLGNFVMFMSAVNFMKKGNKFFLLLGGATGMIGDPSFKNADRNFLSEEQIKHNISALNTQVKQILENVKKMTKGDMKFDFEVVNNADFYKDMSFLKFLREVGKYITVNTMMNKESVKKRIEDPDKSISYTEFTYMLIQGYDFVHLLNTKGVQMQICGSDQRGNGVTGIEMIRKKLDKESYVFTSPLLLDSTGKKFGKSEGNAIWLDEMKNSPYFVYQYFMNTADEDIERFLKVFSLLSFEEIEDIVAKHNENPGARYGQQELAKYVVSIIFGIEKAEQAKKISDLIFSKNGKMDIIAGLDEGEKKAVIAELNNKETFKFDENNAGILDLCVKLGLTKSKGEARKAIQQGGIYINEEKVVETDISVGKNDFINGLLLLRKGKKTYKVMSL